MEVYRTAQQVTKENLISVTAELAKNSFDWYKIEEDEEGTYKRLYLSDTIYFEFIITDSAYNLNVVDTAHSYSVSVQNFGSQYHNGTIFKTSEQCGAFAFATSGTSTPNYSKSVGVAFDTANGGENVAVIVPGTSGTSTIIDGIDDLASTSPTPFLSASGYKTNYIRSQTLPLVNAKTGVAFDNIKAVLYSDIAMGTPVTYNGSNYLFSSGLAIPCNGKLTYVT